MQDLIARLRQLLEPSAVLTGEQLGDKYSVDYTAENPHTPLAILRAKTTEEVAAVMRIPKAASDPLDILNAGRFSRPEIPDRPDCPELEGRCRLEGCDNPASRPVF